MWFSHFEWTDRASHRSRPSGAWTRRDRVAARVRSSDSFRHRARPTHDLYLLVHRLAFGFSENRAGRQQVHLRVYRNDGSEETSAAAEPMASQHYLTVSQPRGA